MAVLWECEVWSLQAFCHSHIHCLLSITHRNVQCCYTFLQPIFTAFPLYRKMENVVFTIYYHTVFGVFYVNILRYILQVLQQQTPLSEWLYTESCIGRHCFITDEWHNTGWSTDHLPHIHFQKTILWIHYIHLPKYIHFCKAGRKRIIIGG